MIRTEKEKVVQELTEKFRKAQAVYLADFQGLDVASITELRGQMRSESVEFLVVKNTLTRLALDEAGFQELKAFLEGPISLTFGYDDPVTPARILVDFGKKHERPEIRGGLLEGRFLTAEQVKSVASLPSRHELLSKVATLAQSPLAGFMNRCHGLLQKLTATIEALRVKRQNEKSEEDNVGQEDETVSEKGV